jgi:hypothetical protein
MESRAWAGARHVFVLCSATGLGEVAGAASRANREHRLRALFVREDIDPEFLGSMLEGANLRFVRNLVVHHGSSVPRRVLRAWDVASQDALIADASVSEGRLHLLSCALERFVISLRDVPALAGVTERERGEFQLAEDGSYLHWPGPDAHLDLDGVRYLVDPVARKRMDVSRLAHDRRFGAAVAQLRRDKGLTQSGIPGVSPRHVRRIEAGSLPRVSTLETMVRAHGMGLDEYLAAIARLARSVSARDGAQR